MISMDVVHERGLQSTPRSRRSSAWRWRVAGVAVLAGALLTSVVGAHPHPDQSSCAAVGSWLDPATAERIATNQLLAGLAQRPVVLLGEVHDNVEHHRWQLYTLAALHGQESDMILGFESFPRRVQPTLDQWVNGELEVGAFLEAVDWSTVWGFDPDLYLPLFEFARQNRIPMIALNVDRGLVSRVRREGWAAIPADEKAGLSDPAAASDAYRKSLAEIYVAEQLHAPADPESGDPHRAMTEAAVPAEDGDPAAGESVASTHEGMARIHRGAAGADKGSALAAESAAPAHEGTDRVNETAARAQEGAAPADESAVAADQDAAAADESAAREIEGDASAVGTDLDSIIESEDFGRFVGAQLTWDRAMAEALAAARRRQPDSLVVGIVGRGHVEHRHGVPHQLVDLGIPDVAVLLPVERAATCEGLPAGLADAVFVIEPTASVAAAPPRARLGVMLAMSDVGVQIASVMEGSVAEAIALQANDIVVAAAGFPITQLSELIAIVQRQAPGTWLPLNIRRDSQEIEFVAKFPTAFDTPE